MGFERRLGLSAKAPINLSADCVEQMFGCQVLSPFPSRLWTRVHRERRKLKLIDTCLYM